MAMAQLRLVLLLSSVLPLVVLALPCEDTGLCSIGQLHPYVGDIRSSDGLRAALAARSYNKEVIIMVVSVGQMMETRGDPLLPTMQMVNNVRKYGMEHILLMSTDPEGCREVLKHFAHLGCVWDSFKLPRKGKDVWQVVTMAHLWHSRWRVTARAVRLGYNVLNLDSDLILFDDPYRYFKSEPFKHYVIINQPEVLYHQDDYRHVDKPNGGVVYIQNARPDGPAAWLVAEVSDRILRWVEDDFNLTMSKGLVTSCCYMDQDCFDDSISAVQMGRPFFKVAMTNCVWDQWKRENQDLDKKRRQAVESAVRDKIQLTTVQLPEWMHPVAGSSTTDLRWFPMYMPNYQGQWPEEYGGKMFPEPRKEMSLEFQKQLREDCGCPMWPDPENASDAEAAEKMPSEKFLWGPPFLTLNYNARGRMGYWNRDFTNGVAQQVIGHAHYIPHTDASVGKQMMKMMSSDYDWGAAHALKKDAVFFANLGKRVNDDVPDMVALHPDVDIQRVSTFVEWSALLKALTTVAAATQRAFVWPTLPCNHPIVNERNRSLDSLPLPLRPDWLPYGPKGKLECTWLYMLSEPCLFEGRGVLPIEFLHLKEHYQHQYDFAHSQHNTIAVPSGRAVKGNLSLPITDSLVEVEESDFKALLEGSNTSKYSKYKVLYLGHPMTVKWGGSNSRKDRWDPYGNCNALKPDWMNKTMKINWMLYEKWQPDHIRTRPGKLKHNGFLYIYKQGHAPSESAASPAAGGRRLRSWWPW